MIERKVISKCHCMVIRPSCMLANTIARFKCPVFLEKDGIRVNAKSFMGVITLMMMTTDNRKFTAIADGEDEVEAMETLVKLFDRDFEEIYGYK